MAERPSRAVESKNDSMRGSALDHVRDAIADIEANVGGDGPKPYEQVVLGKLRSMEVILAAHTRK